MKARTVLAAMLALALCAGDGELSRVIEDLVKEMKKGNGRTAESPR